MIANTARPDYPLLAAIVRRHDDAARPGNYNARTVFGVDAVKRGIRRTGLFLPLKTAVARGKHNSVVTNGPTVFLIGCKSDGVD